MIALPDGHVVERCDQRKGRPLWRVSNQDGTRRGYPGSSPADAVARWHHEGETKVLWTIHLRYADGYSGMPHPVLSRQKLLQSIRARLSENDRKDRWVCVQEFLEVPDSVVPHMIADGERYWEIAHDKTIAWSDAAPSAPVPLPLPWEGTL